MRIEHYAINKHLKTQGKQGGTIGDVPKATPNPDGTYTISGKIKYRRIEDNKVIEEAVDFTYYIDSENNLKIKD